MCNCKDKFLEGDYDCMRCELTKKAALDKEEQRMLSYILRRKK